MKKTVLLLVFLLANITAAFAQTELTDANVEEKVLVKNDRLIVLEFYTDWCGYCKKMKPIISDLANDYKDRVDFYKINADENKVDEALGVTGYPAYYFIKNSENLEVIEGAVSKESMAASIELLIHSDQLLELLQEYEEGDKEGEEEYNVWTLHDEPGELSEKNYQHIWDDSAKLNSLAWHVYKEHYVQYDFVRAIDIVKRSIELEANYANIDTHAALLYKTQNYTEALKKAIEAFEVAKLSGDDYSVTLELMEKIIEQIKKG